MPSLDDLDASMDQEDGADMECGGSETVQMAQVSCCTALEKVLIEHIASTPHTLPLCRCAFYALDILLFSVPVFCGNADECHRVVSQ